MTWVWDLSPIAFELGASAIRVYALLFVASIVSGLVLFRWQVLRGGGDAEEAGDFLVYGFLGVLLGARLGHVLVYDTTRFLEDPTYLLRIWDGGLASHGALLGVALGLFLFMRRRGLPFLEGADRLCFSGALAVPLIRFGNLWNSELVGRVTDGTWGICFPAYDHQFDLFRHPVQIYEAALGLAVLSLLLVCDRWWGKEERPLGALTGVFLLTYFAGRIVVEGFREDELVALGWPVTLGQLLSAPLVVVGGLLLLHSLRFRRPTGWKHPVRISRAEVFS